MSAAAVAEWRESCPSVYSLTDLTGKRKNAEATTYVGSFEVGRQTILVFVIGAIIVGGPIAGLLAYLLSIFELSQFLYVSLAGPVVGGFAAVWLFVQRENKGLRLLRYQGILDRRKARANAGKVFVCGREVRPATVSVLIPVVIDTPTYMLDALRGPGPVHDDSLASIATPWSDAAPAQTDADTDPNSNPWD